MKDFAPHPSSDDGDAQRLTKNTREAHQEYMRDREAHQDIQRIEEGHSNYTDSLRKDKMPILSLRQPEDGYEKNNSTEKSRGRKSNKPTRERQD